MKKSIILVLLALFIITPFSQVLAVGTDYRYTGKPLDSSTNLYYYGQRYYEPNIGRFTQPDPVSRYLTDPQKLKQSTGQDLQKFLQNPQALNEYGYVQNNPVKYVDPNGEIGVLALLATVAWVAFTAWDIHDAYKTSNSTQATLGEKIINYGSLALDVFPATGASKGVAKVGIEAVKVGKVAEKSKDVVKLVHVSDKATDIIKNGFEAVKGLWVNNLSKSNPFLGEHTIMNAIYDADRMMKGGDYGKFIFEVPKVIYDKLVKEKLIDISKTYETFIKPAAMEIISTYLKK